MNYLGIDVGGTSVKAGLVDERGRLLYSRKVPTDVSQGRDGVIHNIVKVSEAVICQSRRPVAAAGIGVPGPVDMERGIVANCVNLKWNRVPIAALLREKLHVPVFAGNDGNLACLGELKAGALQGVDSGVMLTLGTGIGGGVVQNGTLWIGAHNIGGEMGHMVVGHNFYDCNCGRNGCLETFSSATAMKKYAARLMRQGRKCPVLWRMCAGRGHRINVKMLFEAYRQNDPVARDTILRAAHYLGIGIVNITAICDPQRVAVGGGVSQAGELYIHLIRKAAEDARYFKELPIPEVVLAELGNHAGIIGAAILAQTKVRKKERRARK